VRERSVEERPRPDEDDVTLRGQIEAFIADVFERNRRTPCALRGGAFCAGFERPPDGEPWVQVKTGVFNIFYPSDQPPLETLRARVPSLHPETICVAWEPWRYATLEGTLADAAAAAALVEELFVLLYEFPPGSEVRMEVFDMREA